MVLKLKNFFSMELDFLTEALRGNERICIEKEEESGPDGERN